MVRLLDERSDTKSNVKLGRFRSQLQASYVSSHIEELWYNETVCQWMTIYIYIYIYIIIVYIYIYIYIYIIIIFIYIDIYISLLYICVYTLCTMGDIVGRHIYMCVCVCVHVVYRCMFVCIRNYYISIKLSMYRAIYLYVSFKRF